MAAIDDLNTAIATLNTSVSNCTNVLQELSAKITAGSVDPAAVEAAVAQLSTINANLNTAVAAAQSVLNQQ